MRKNIIFILSVMLIASSITACDSKPIDTAENGHKVINYADSGESIASVTSSRPKEISSSSSEENVSKTSHEITENSSAASSNYSSVISSSSSISSRIVSSSITSSTVQTYTIYYHEDDKPDESKKDKPEPNSDNNESTSELSSRVIPDTDSDTDTSSEYTSSVEPITYGSYTEEDIAFYINGSKIYLGDNAQNALSIMGEPIESDITDYNYSDFWVAVSSDHSGEELKVSEIQIFGSGIETEKGVKVGMTLDEVKSIYGESSSVVNDEYRYYVDNKYMYIYVQNDTVLNIGYRIDNEVETSEVSS